MNLPFSRVVIVDIDLPFFRIVSIMVKWSIASIPAALILSAIGFLIFLLATVLGAGLFGLTHPHQ